MVKFTFDLNMVGTAPVQSCSTDAKEHTLELDPDNEAHPVPKDYDELKKSYARFR